MESICRLCCTSHEILKMQNLFVTANRCLVDKLNYFACFTFRINENDGFPPYICIRCTDLLKAAYEFKMICESAEANFWALSQSNDDDVAGDDCSSPIKFNELTDDDRQFRLEHLEVTIDSHVMEADHGMEIDSQIFSYDVCGSEQTNKFDLITHMDVHQRMLRIERRKISRKVTSWTCDNCNESFRLKRDLDQHLKIDHNSRLRKKSWICETCGKDFTSQYSLKYHINGTHVDSVQKNYSCDLCDFKCRQARYLVSHALKHTGEKRHRCDECGAAFGFHGSLMRHIQAVHRHEKRHKCPICDRNFKTKFRLKEHSYIHSGVDPHECGHCSRTYRYKNSLIRHVKKWHRAAVVTKSLDAQLKLQVV